MPSIILTDNVIKKAVKAVKRLKEGEIVAEFRFGEKAGGAFVSLDPKALIAPQTVLLEGQTFYVSLWKKDR